MIRAVIIGETLEQGIQLKSQLEQDSSRVFKKIDVYNSIDTFVSDSYMHTQLDVILLDMKLSLGIPPVEGVNIIKNTAHFRQAKILFLTSPADHQYSIFKLLCYSGGSYMPGEAGSSEIIGEITSLISGGGLINRAVITRMSSEVTYGILDKYIALAPLSKREKEIIRRIVTERQSDLKMMAKELNIKNFLLRRYIRNTFVKLQNYSTQSLLQDAAPLLRHQPRLVLGSVPHQVDYRNAG